MTQRACLYKGSVFHKRFVPKAHFLKYNVTTLFIDLDELETLNVENRFFSLNSFNFMSIYEKDYGDPDDNSGFSLSHRIKELLSKNSIDRRSIKTIKMLTYPRVFGFVFNPLTVFYCYDHNDEHLALIYEVRNTFGERHNYIYKVDEGKKFSDQHEVDKCFHVSPFFDREGYYQFKINDPERHASVLIDYFKDDEKLMTANFIGKKIPFNNASILALCLRTPFMTIKVVAGIMFEALRLKFKGLKVFSHPERHSYQSTWAIQSTQPNKNTQFISSNNEE